MLHTNIITEGHKGKDRQANTENPEKSFQQIPSFPSKLLYIPKNMLGLEFKCPTRSITTTKMAIIHRAHLQPKDVGSIRAGILVRP